MAEKKRFTTTNREEAFFEVDGQDYVLVPASGIASRKYREAALMGAELEMVGDGNDQRKTFKRMEGIAAIEARLVADCCYLVLKDGGRQGPLTPEFVEDKFPGDCIKWAFDECKRISPWLEERSSDGLAKLKAERDKLDARIRRMEATDPKASLENSTTTS